ncbi:hypothetical protein BGZ83_006333 [Gryganskiella cystojenkinii]|nr:hypothetical protein BGZ83_006333 [Gryganskiella cystojenkinii]
MASDYPNTPRVILGTMTFGLEDTQTELSVIRVRGVEAVRPFIEKFTAYGHVEIDTARIYGRGDTEVLLSQLPNAHLKLATKAYPMEEHGFNSVKLPKQFRQSLEALKVPKVDLFYLHAPDVLTPLEETLKVVNDLYKEGLFERFGVSNYPAWQVALIHQICKQNGYVLPTVYQGILNPIVRAVVPELLPCLKHLGISFYAYNPIAGGMLSGKYKFDQEVEEGSRYDTKTGFGALFRNQYWNQLTFEAVQILVKASEANHIPLLEATLRWMNHHSGLEAKDGIIIGASQLKHLEENLEDLKKGPLPKAMVEAFDEAWEKVKAVSPTYFRSVTVYRPQLVKKD